MAPVVAAAVTATVVSITVTVTVAVTVVAVTVVAVTVVAVTVVGAVRHPDLGDLPLEVDVHPLGAGQVDLAACEAEARLGGVRAEVAAGGDCSAIRPKALTWAREPCL